MASRRTSASAVSAGISGAPSALALQVFADGSRGVVGSDLRLLAGRGAAVKGPLEGPLLRRAEARPRRAERLEHRGAVDRRPADDALRQLHALHAPVQQRRELAQRGRRDRPVGADAVGDAVEDRPPEGRPQARELQRRELAGRRARVGQRGGRPVAQDGEPGAAAERDRDVGDALGPPRRGERRRAEGERRRLALGLALGVAPGAERGAGGRRVAQRERLHREPDRALARALAEGRGLDPLGAPDELEALRQHRAQRAARRGGAGGRARQARHVVGLERQAIVRRGGPRGRRGRAGEEGQEGEREQGGPEAVARNDVAPSKTGGARRTVRRRADGGNPPPRQRSRCGCRSAATRSMRADDGS